MLFDLNENIEQLFCTDSGLDAKFISLTHCKVYIRLRIKNENKTKQKVLAAYVYLYDIRIEDVCTKTNYISRDFLNRVSLALS